MIQLPEFSRRWEYENFFYLTAEAGRFGKLVAHYELLKLVAALPGAIVECGVFKGASLARLIGFRDVLGAQASKPIIGFDTFGSFPETKEEKDQLLRARFIAEAGEESIGKEQLAELLRQKGVADVELVAGDIIQSVPEYVRAHPELSIALLNLDTDIYEPAAVALEHFYPRLVAGGILMLDDYGVFPGETKAVDEYFQGRNVKIQRMSNSFGPPYIVKP
jgi:hypothetical protein